ncbi:MULTISPECIES: nuclear transport factor 2 family protein [Streptosporangium]|uniref:Ketosteroid isomerase-like protein n=1 Tax=Streptosporangium brasiliense TaxID=47480 RepID=A0ABT9RLG3_9ACTN|nr:nuclear transport factor 2 family protein [Streptosporangium brasiliense]MDP9869933.1 ketosteroid isomerase-like protein [Streptosporangium brasiliense]
MAREAAWAVITAMYDAYGRGDRAGIDRLLHPEATIWDSADPALITSLAQLDKVRDARPADGPQETGVRAHDEVVDVWGETALARYLLRVDFAEGEPEIVRTTAVLRLVEGEWLIVHIHENTI